MTIEPLPKTLVDLLRWRATQTPDDLAYTFLEDGEDQATSLTYAELDQWARTIAAYLQQRAAAGERALLLYPSGLAYVAAFFGCIYAGVLAVPLYPPRSRSIDERIQRISQDAQANFALTTGKIADKVQQSLSESPAFAKLQWVATDQLALEQANGWQMPELTNTSLAYLQYTSGSTSMPKGVMVSHGNLLYNMATIAKGLVHGPADLLVSWLPLYHDLGLIFGILYPLYQAMRGVFFSSTAFVERPYRWLHAISHYKATHSVAPNFAYDLCVAKISPEQRSTLELSRWRYTLNGAEPIQPGTLDTFATTFAPCGFAPVAHSPAYGLAEATLAVTLNPQLSMPESRQFQVEALQQNHAIATDETLGGRFLVGCGVTMLDTQAIIVNSETLTQCAADEIGEIWVGGPTVAQGYWQNEAATQETFRAYLADTGQGPFLRTGDLGFLHEDQLFVTGRLKDLIILRGRNHYPQDIELTAQSSHAACRLGWGAAFAVYVNDDGLNDAHGNEQLVVVQEVERTALHSLKGEEVIWAIRRAIGEEHGIHPYAIVLTKPGSIPKTSSGKIQRRACRARFLQNQFTVLASWQTESGGSSSILTQENELHAVITQGVGAGSLPKPTVDAIQSWLIQWLTTRLPTAAEKIHTTTAFADYGLDSMMALELLAGLAAWLQKPLEMEPTLFWNYPTISALATYLANGQGQTNRQPVHDSAHTQPLSPNANGLTPDKTRLSALSDDQIAQLLAQEIKASRMRRAG